MPALIAPKAKLADAIKLRRLPIGDLAGVRLLPAEQLSAKQLSEFCQDNPDLRIEQNATGELIIMLPSHTDSGFRESKLLKQFYRWEGAERGGELFDSNAGFTLSNGAMRSPDISWVRQEKLDQLTPEQWRSFAPICPDFVAELRSRTDRLPSLKEKMVEYLENGARLGWLIDPLGKQVFVYCPGQPVEHLLNPATLSGEPVLAGFTLDLARVW